jgi:hypothetical protein
MNGERKWWFERRESGFGWGMPTCWQGWVVLVAFIVSMTAGIPLVGARYGQTGATLLIVALIAGLLIVLLLKGEPL